VFTKEEWEGIEFALMGRIQHLEEWPKEHGYEKISESDQAVVDWTRQLLNKVAQLKAKQGG
jgi:hypothetical protein